MLKTPHQDQPFWRQSLLLTGKGIALGIFFYYLRVEFNISVGQKSGVPEEIDFTWLGLASWIASFVALLNFFGWFGYLQKNIDKDQE